MAGFTSCHTHFHLREGDLLFHVVGDGQDNAITDVTPGRIDHVAIFIGTKVQGNEAAEARDYVVEAIGNGVVTTPLDSLLERDGGRYLAGRVSGIDRRRSVSNALTYLGRPYDHLYSADDEAVYCSELVQLSFVDRHGQRVFAPVPMSFHDSTGIVTPYWRDYYNRQGLEVPEGQPGTNPGELSQRKQVKLLPF